METNQSTISQNLTGAEAQPQQTRSNNSLFAAIIISVLLTAIIVGSGVYFWQKSASEKETVSLKQKISSLEKQISTMNKVEIAPQSTPQPSLSFPSTHRAKVSEETIGDETAGWKIYRNENYAFEMKYPPFLKMTSKGPNLEQRKIEKGEIISGTVQPSYETIIFSDENDKRQFSVEIFGLYEKIISEENYKDDYLYLFGACDLRWGFKPTAIGVKHINNNKVLEVKGEMPHMETLSFRGCYYLKNYANLIVFSTTNLDNQSDFQGVSEMLLKTLSTFRFLK